MQVLEKNASWKSDLNALLSPRSIAVVGATEKIGPGRNAVRCLLDMGFDGEIYPIHPKYEQVFSLPCYRSLSDLPQTPDLAVISVRAELALDSLRECEEQNIKNVTVFSSGFSEMGAQGTTLQKQMTEIAHRAGIRLCGPNCLGHLDVNHKTGAYSASILQGTKPGKVAVVSQSGSMAIAMYQSFKELGLSHVISYGNQAVLDLSDYLMFLAEDPHTEIITTFIEGVGDGEKFIRALQKCKEKRKAVVAIKIGKSEVGKKIALAHTAAIVGSNSVYGEVFGTGNVLEVADIDEMLQTVTALVKTHPLQKKGVAFLAISGGQCGLVGDLSEQIGLEIPAFSETTVRRIESVVPSFVNVRNPLDVSSVGSDNYEEYLRVLKYCMEDEQIGIAAVMQDAPYGVGASTVGHYSKIAKAVIEASKETGKPILVFTNHSTPCEPKIMQGLVDAGLPLLQGTRESLCAIKHLTDYYCGTGEPESLPPPVNPEIAKTLRSTLLRCREHTACLGETEAKQLLGMLGVPVTRDHPVTSPAELAQVLGDMSFPVALKIDSPDILHKTDVGGVALGLNNEADAQEAYSAMLVAVGENAPSARLNGVTVQEMAPEGVDVIVGMHKDPQFGPILVFGLGGIYVEVFKDSAIGLIPVSREKARGMIRRSKSYSLLGEVRGRKALDIELLADILMAVSSLVDTCGDLIREIDLNPVRIGTFGARVLDALIVLE